MKWNKKFNYQKHSRSNENGVRKYLFGDNKLPSVTSILAQTKSDEEKASLELWKKRVGYKEANRIKTEASSRGSSMHSYIEDYLRGRVNESFFESNEQYKNMAKEIIEKGIKGKIDEIYGMEETLYYPEKYAGTADLICKYQGHDVLIDFGFLEFVELLKMKYPDEEVYISSARLENRKDIIADFEQALSKI